MENKEKLKHFIKTEDPEANEWISSKCNGAL
jgi:hypothetical protein